MADIVYSMACHPPDLSDEDFAELVQVARLWAAHLRGPGEHDGPILLISDAPGLEIEGVEVIHASQTQRVGRQIMTLKVLSAVEHIRPTAGDRLIQMDTDALTRRPLRPVFESVRQGEMRAATSSLHLTHWQQVGHLIGKWSRRWRGYVHGWHHRLGVSASVTGCHGADWPHFMGIWDAMIRRCEKRDLPRPLPGDQAYLNYLYAYRKVPVRHFDSEDVSHVRPEEPATPESLAHVRVLHFPGGHKLERMRAWSCACLAAEALV